MKFLTLIFAVACSTPSDVEDFSEGESVVVVDSDIVQDRHSGLSRYVDSRYGVVCYSTYGKTLQCFPVDNEGNAQYTLINNK